MNLNSPVAAESSSIAVPVSTLMTGLLMAVVVSTILVRARCFASCCRYHMTPLLYACDSHHREVASILISAKADVNKQDIRGWTVREGDRERAGEGERE